MHKNTFFSLLFLHFGLMKLGFSKRFSWLPLLSLLILKRDVADLGLGTLSSWVIFLSATYNHRTLLSEIVHWGVKCQYWCPLSSYSIVLPLSTSRSVRFKSLPWDHDKAIFWLRTVFFTFDLIWSFYNIRLTTWGPDNKGKFVKVFTFYLLLLCQPILQSVIIATLKSSSSTTSWTLSVPS